MVPILAFWEAPPDYMALEYYLDIPWVMSILLVPHSPILVAWERRTTASHRLTKKKIENVYMDVINNVCDVIIMLYMCRALLK